jgi:TPR repeat protein
MNPNDLYATSTLSQDLTLAGQGNTDSALRTGFRYFTGAAGTINVANARQQFALAAAKTPAASAFLGYLDLIYNPSSAFKAAGAGRMTSAAGAGDAIAQTLLGRMYHTGCSQFPQSSQKAQALYSATAGSFALAQAYLGALTLSSSRLNQAMALFKAASAAGEVLGDVLLADYYLKKAGRPEIMEATRLLTSAAGKGNHFAMYRLAQVYRDGVGGAPPSANRLSFNLFHKAAKMGYRPAQIQVSACYAAGRGIGRDGRLAVFWLKMSQSKGRSL